MNFREFQASVEARLSAIEPENPVMVCNRRENNTNREQQKSTRMCFQYARRGTCKYGNSFRYVYVEDNNNNVKRSEQRENTYIKQKNKDEKILLIGSSIFKTIKPDSLRNIHVWINRGATVLDIFNDLKQIDMSKYHTVVVHVGGNDVSQRMSPKEFIQIYSDIIHFIRHKHCKIVISEILPRAGCNISYLGVIRGAQYFTPVLKIHTP